MENKNLTLKTNFMHDVLSIILLKNYVYIYVVVAATARFFVTRARCCCRSRRLPRSFERWLNLVAVILNAVVSPNLGARHATFDPWRLGTLDHAIDIKIG